VPSSHLTFRNYAGVVKICHLLFQFEVDRRFSGRITRAAFRERVSAIVQNLPRAARLRRHLYQRWSKHRTREKCTISSQRTCYTVAVFVPQASCSTIHGESFKKISTLCDLLGFSRCAVKVSILLECGPASLVDWQRQPSGLISKNRGDKFISFWKFWPLKGGDHYAVSKPGATTNQYGGVTFGIKEITLLVLRMCWDETVHNECQNQVSFLYED